MNATAELKRVTKRYGKIEAVREVSFDLPAGETIALVGHNGAGKTTLLKLMLGLVHPSDGSLRVLGENPAHGEFEARRRLGYLPNEHDVTAMEPEDGCWRALGAPGGLYRLCANADHNACNWLLPADGADTFCIACQHNRTIPDLTVLENRERWRDGGGGRGNWGGGGPGGGMGPGGGF